MPSDNTLYVSQQGETLSTNSVASRRDTRWNTWWAKVPQSAIIDKRLQHIDIRVFAVISLHASKAKHPAPKPVEIGTRFIGETLGLSKDTVARSIARLIRFEHIRKSDATRGKRAVYEFVSQCFLLIEKRDDGVILVTGYSGVSKHAGVVPEPVIWPRAPRKKTA